jgi:hypothetical protein
MEKLEKGSLACLNGASLGWGKRTLFPIPISAFSSTQSTGRPRQRGVCISVEFDGQAPLESKQDSLSSSSQ